MEQEEYKKGRGAQLNTVNRFESQAYDRGADAWIDDWEEQTTKTRFYEEQARTIVNPVKSPDIRMAYSANPYQGCEHGCIYCYARNTHEYWGWSAGLDFESKILVKKNAAELLRKQFERKTWQPAPISLSGNTDCYQPAERTYRLTRAMLEVCLEFRNPVGIITKNALVLRDLDLLKELAAQGLTQVFISITSVDEQKRLWMEPRTASYARRFEVVKKLSAAGIPVGVMNAPLIPGLNDMDMYAVLKAAHDNGARFVGYTMVRLNGAVAVLFKDWLEKTFPDRAEKIWHQVEAAHGGQVGDSRFGVRMKGEGHLAEMIRQQFTLYCRKFKFNQEPMDWNLSAFRRMKGGQLSLF